MDLDPWVNQPLLKGYIEVGFEAALVLGKHTEEEAVRK
jgi:hypothetical protein